MFVGEKYIKSPGTLFSFIPEIISKCIVFLKNKLFSFQLIMYYAYVIKIKIPEPTLDISDLVLL